MGWRRTLLITAGITAATGGWVWAAFFNTGEYRLGLARLIPPLLRTRIGGEDRLFGLVRRRETETLPTLSLRDADAGERIELRAWNAATLEPVFAAPLLSIGNAQHGDAGIIGEQAATIWVHIGGLGAASAVDGRMLADAEGIRAGNPVLTMGLPESRAAFRFGQALEFTDALRAAYRLDPRNFRVGSVRDALPAGLPPAQPPAPWVAAGVPGLAQARPGGTWMGLLPATAMAGDPRLANLTAGPVRLWRSTVAAEAVPVPPPPPVAAGKPQAAAPAPVASPAAAATVAVEDGPLLNAMLLAEGRDALQPAGAPGVLLIYRAAPDGPWRLARVGADGAVAWRATLPLAVVNAVLPGNPALILAGRRAGTDRNTGPEAIVSLDLATGALRARDVASNDAITA